MLLGFRFGFLVKIFGCFCRRTKEEIEIVEDAEDSIMDELCVINIIKQL